MNTNFIAVDFETATNSRMACQLGVVVVKGGVITDKKSYLIQPPKNEYDPNVMLHHRVTPEMTQSAPTFEEIWPTIQPHFTSLPVYAHNASFDSDVLNKNLDYYNLMPMGIQEFCCTCSPFQMTKLEHLCIGFEIPYDANQHHNALYDAECCAQFALKHLAGNQPDWDKIELYKQANETDKDSNSSGRFRQKLKGDILQKDLSQADPNNPFYDRKIVITGELSIERRKLGVMLKSMGADLDTSISKKTNFVITGDGPGPAKLAKLDKLNRDGYNVVRLYESDLMTILNGNYINYQTEKKLVKDLDFTMNHFRENKVSIRPGVNMIASKELYYGKGLAGSLDIFRQICGNLGAAGDVEIYPETNICVLSDNTLSKLEQGEKDETIQYIQNYYNSNKSITFELRFIAESDILEFCKTRCEGCDDELTLDMYERYMEPAIKIQEEISNSPKYEFEEGKNYCKIDGKYVIKLSDGRTWCPSRQFR